MLCCVAALFACLLACFLLRGSNRLKRGSNCELRSSAPPPAPPPLPARSHRASGPCAQAPAKVCEGQDGDGDDDHHQAPGAASSRCTSVPFPDLPLQDLPSTRGVHFLLSRPQSPRFPRSLPPRPSDTDLLARFLPWAIKVDTRSRIYEHSSGDV